MISIIMKPVHGAPSIKGEGLYDAVFRGGERLFRVRARNATAAEEKVMIVFRHELRGKGIDFDAADFPDFRKPLTKENENGEMPHKGGVPGAVQAGGGRVCELPPPGDGA